MSTNSGFVPKSQLVYETLRARILTATYEPGATLHQAALAAELGVSTTPLREALRRLQAEQLVELRGHSDARVTALTAEDARDLVELRLALDPLAVGLAAERRTRTDLEAIRALLPLVSALPDRPDIDQLVAHRRFHQAIYRASHNDLLASSLDALWDKADRYRLLGLRAPRTDAQRAESDSEHRRLVDAVVAGDADAARAVMRTHIEGSLGAKAAHTLATQTQPADSVA